MAALSEALEEGAKAAHATSVQSFVEFRRDVLLQSLLGFAVMIVVSSIVARSIPRPFSTLIGRLVEAAKASTTYAGQVAETSTSLA